MTECFSITSPTGDASGVSVQGHSQREQHEFDTALSVFKLTHQGAASDPRQSLMCTVALFVITDCVSSGRNAVASVYLSVRFHTTFVLSDL